MRKFALALLKVVIVVGCGFYIYTKVSGFRDSNSSSNWAELVWVWPAWLVLSLAFGLAISGWWAEAQKWKCLFRDEWSLTFRRALRIVLIALAGGILSPLRVGEYGMRSYLAPANLRTHAIGRHWVSNLSLNTVRVLVAGIPCIYFAGIFPGFSLPLYFLVPIWVLLAMVMLLVYFKGAHWLLKYLPERVRGWQKEVPTGASIEPKRGLELLGLSAIRYLSYSIANVVLWLGLGLYDDAFIIFSLFQVLYMASVILPVISLFDIVIKGSLAILLSEPFGIAPGGVVLAMFINWVFTTGLPLLAGALLLLKQPIKASAK